MSTGIGHTPIVDAEESPERPVTWALWSNMTACTWKTHACTVRSYVIKTHFVLWYAPASSARALPHVSF